MFLKRFHRIQLGYMCDYSDVNGCGDDKGLVVNTSVVNLGEDTTLCVNETVDLDAGNPGWMYEWNTETGRFLIRILGDID